MALMSFQSWLIDVNGESIDNSAGYSPQCTDLWRDYLMRVVGAPWGVGHAQSYAWQLWTLFEKDPDRPALYLNKVSAGAPAHPGDGVIWGTGLVKPTGHVAIVMEDLGKSLRVMNQNYDGHPYSEVSIISKNYVLGYLRPKVKTSNPKPPTTTPPTTTPPAKTPEQLEEEELMAAKDEIIAAFEQEIATLTSRMRREIRPELYFVSVGPNGTRYNEFTAPFAAAIQPASGFILPLSKPADRKSQVESLRKNYRTIAQDAAWNGLSENAFMNTIKDIAIATGQLPRDTSDADGVTWAYSLFD